MTKKYVLMIALAASAAIGQTQSVQAACLLPTFTPAEKKVVPTKNIDQVLFSNAIARQTNYYRCKRGLRSLEQDNHLIKAAKIHSQNMVRLKKIKHVLPVSGSRTPNDRFRKADVSANRAIAENVGTDFRYDIGNRYILIKDATSCRFEYFETREPVGVHSYGSLAQSIVQNLWNSPSHRTNLLNRKITRVGAAAYFTIDQQAPCGTYYFTQNFAG